MMLVDGSLLAVAVFFAIYGLTSSIECGIALSFLAGQAKSTRRLFTPLWEVTNVFLVFGFTALAMLFSGALHELSSALLSTLIIGLSALIIRACVVLTIFYWRSEKLPRWLAWLFALSCYTIPLSFASAGIYLFSGQYFWQSFTGWSLMAAALLGVTALGLVTVNFKRNKNSLMTNELFFAAWMLVLGSVVPLAASISIPQTQKTPMAILSLLSIIGLFLALLTLTSKPQLRLWKFGALAAFLSPILLAWANRPYLIRGHLTLNEAFSADSYAKAFMIGTIIVLPLILLGFWLFWELLRQPN